MKRNRKIDKLDLNPIFIKKLLQKHKPVFSLKSLEKGGELTLLLTSEFLKFFLATSAALMMPDSLSYYKMKRNQDDFLDLLNNLDIKNWRKNRSLKKLKEKGFIKNNFRLTRKGFNKSLFILINNIAIKIPKIWDGKWRMLIFDIPKNYAGNRNFLRNHLIDIGFIQIQKSVWAFPFPCKKEIKFLIELTKTEKYTYFITGKIHNDLKFIKAYKKIFPKQFKKY